MLCTMFSGLRNEEIRHVPGGKVMQYLVINRILEFILIFTGTQWKDAQIGAMWDRWIALANSLAAAF